MALSRRLDKILSLVESGVKICFDVGCDHGKLAEALVDKKQVGKVYASDISAPSLDKTKDLVKKRGFESKIICILSDGLKSYPKGLKADYVIIAGMGGIETKKILTEIEDNSLYDRFIFEPMKDAKILREYLMEEGYPILYDEIVVERGKAYSVILSGGKTGRAQKYETKDIFFGKDDVINLSEGFKSVLIKVKQSLESRSEFLKNKDKEKLNWTQELLNKYK